MSSSFFGPFFFARARLGVEEVVAVRPVVGERVPRDGLLDGPAADVREAAAEAVEQTVARDALANDWTNSDYLLDAKPGAWDDDEAAPAAPAKKKGPKKDDDKPHAFLYGKTSRQMR